MGIRLFLGDHSFHRLRGQNGEDQRILGLMRHAAGRGLAGLAAWEERFLELAARTRDQFPELGLMLQTDLEFDLLGPPLRRAGADEAGAGLLKAIESRGLHLAILDDPIAGKFLRQCRPFQPLDLADKRWRLSEGWSQSVIGLVERHRPDCVAIGGDVLDCAAYQGLGPEQASAIMSMVGAIRKLGARCLLTSYLVAVVDFGFLDELFDGYMVPYNALGAGMLPDPASASARLRRLAKPITAMHLLAEGLLQPRPAIAWALEEGLIKEAVVGASSEERIDAMAEAGKRAEQ
jgi:hypothetical protein